MKAALLQKIPTKQKCLFAFSFFLRRKIFFFFESIWRTWEGDLDINIEGESDAEEVLQTNSVYVGPSKSKLEDKRKWAEHSVDTDPSLHSQIKSYKLDPQVRWAPQESRRKMPLDYFYKAFPTSYISTILDVKKKEENIGFLYIFCTWSELLLV